MVILLRWFGGKYLYLYINCVVFSSCVFLIHYMFSIKLTPGSQNRMSNTVYEVDFSTLETMDHYSPIVLILKKKAVTMIQTIISLQNGNNNGEIYRTWHENNSTGQILV